jgi:hypothetical protein
MFSRSFDHKLDNEEEQSSEDDAKRVRFQEFKDIDDFSAEDIRVESIRNEDL